MTLCYTLIFGQTKLNLNSCVCVGLPSSCSAVECLEPAMATDTVSQWSTVKRTSLWTSPQGLSTTSPSETDLSTQAWKTHSTYNWKQLVSNLSTFVVLTEICPQHWVKTSVNCWQWRHHRLQDSYSCCSLSPIIMPTLLTPPSTQGKPFAGRHYCKSGKLSQTQV